MVERVLSIEIPILLPGVGEKDDGCLRRVEEALANRKGILRAHVKSEPAPIHLCLHYDPGQVSIEEVRRMAERAGAQINSRYRHEAISVEGMDCSDCALVVEHSLQRMGGVLSASVSYATQAAQVEYDGFRTNRALIVKRVRQLGYEVPVAGLHGWYRENRRLVRLVLAAGLLMVSWLFERSWGAMNPAALAAVGLAYGLVGFDPARHAFLALRQRAANTDLLMVLAAAGAAFVGEPLEGGLLLVLFNLGHVLEDRALDRARRSIARLAEIAPRTATVRRFEKEVEVPLDRVSIGETVIVRPGVRIPVDGSVAAGKSAVDQGPVTGESIPVDKGPGDEVFAGSLNGECPLEVRVTRLARDSTLSRVIEAVEMAKARKSPVERWSERITRILVPTVLVVDMALIPIGVLGGLTLAEAVIRAMVVLVAASPCALALSAPSAVLAGTARAARAGVLIKGGAYLEALADLEALAFDKTGTITDGKPKVLGIHPAEGIPAGRVLRLAASVEALSTHPLARAIVQEARVERLSLSEAAGMVETAGVGVKGHVDGNVVSVARSGTEEDDPPLPAKMKEQRESLERDAKTVVVVRQDEDVIGLISLGDAVRQDALQVVASLKAMGIKRSVLLTGDHPRAAMAAAAQAGLDEAQAGLLPHQKAAAVAALARRFRAVGMIGDGINDAPALAAATVGIAMGSAGSDIALESADVALMADDLSQVPFVIALARATKRVILQNLSLSLGVMIGLFGLALAGKMSLTPAVFLHEGSSILVVLNALRLLRFR